MTTPLSQLLEERYCINPPRIQERLLNACIATILSHRSIRSFALDPLPEGMLELLVAAAQSAATSAHLQTWSVVAVLDPDRKQLLSELAGNQASVRECPLFLVWLADLARLAQLAQAAGFPGAGLDYTELLVTAVADASLAAQSAVVAAESLGLGTVYIGGIRNHPLAVAECLALPGRTVAVFGLCVGYPHPAVRASVKPRLPQTVVLHRERYELPNEQEMAAYDLAMARFYEQNQPQAMECWSVRSAKRVMSADALAGRDRLKAALVMLGFPLL
jgi:nitroreductase